MPKKSTAISTKTKAASSTLPAHIKEGAARGITNVTSKDMSMPFLRLAQEKTPQVIDELVDQGDFFNSVTAESFGKTVDIIVVLAAVGQMRFGDYKKKEGILCKSANGIKADMKGGKDEKGKATDDCTSCVLKDWVDNEKPACTRQARYMVIVKGKREPMMLILSNTSYPAARKVNTILGTSGMDTFAVQIRLSSKKNGDTTSIEAQASPDKFASKADYEFAERLFIGNEKTFAGKVVADDASN